MRNTKEKGFIRIVVFPYKDHFVGACLDFNIIEEGENPQLLQASLLESALGYIETVRKEGLEDELLNQAAPKEYWSKYEQLRKVESSKAELPKAVPAWLLNSYQTTHPFPAIYA